MNVSTPLGGECALHKRVFCNQLLAMLVRLYVLVVAGGIATFGAPECLFCIASRHASPVSFERVVVCLPCFAAHLS